MKTLSKKVVLAAIILSPLSVSAEIQAIDDGAMDNVVGQSGIVLELNIGEGPKTLFDPAGKWADAGYSTEAFKWEVDVQSWDNTTNTISMGDLVNGSGAKVLGGVIAKDSQVAGQVDITIDAVGDSDAITVGVAGYDGNNVALAGAAGIGITFNNSNLSFRVGDFGFYLAGVGQTSSVGALEVIGMRIDGLDVAVRGNAR